MVPGDHLVPLGVVDFQAHLVLLGIPVWRVLQASVAQLAGRETPDLLVSPVSVAILVLLVLMVLRVLLVSQDQFLQLMASSSPGTVRVKTSLSVLRELTSSMTDTLCSTCRATSGPTDRT